MNNKIDTQTATKIFARAEQLAKEIEDELETVAGGVDLQVGPAMLQGLQTQLIGKGILDASMVAKTGIITVIF